MQWFRFYSRTLNNPKAQRLPDATFKVWVNLLCVANEHGGALPEIQTLAFHLRMDESDLAGRLLELVQAGLLDNEGDSYRPHDWDEHQYQSDTSTERSRRSRQKKKQQDGDVACNDTATLQQRCMQQDGNVAATVPEAEAEADTETDTATLLGAREVTDEIRRRVKSQTGDEPPDWFGLQGFVDVWLKRGCDPELDIYPTFQAIIARQGSPPQSPKYFADAVLQAKSDRYSALSKPEPKANERTRARFTNPPKPSRSAAVLDALAKAGG